MKGNVTQDKVNGAIDEIHTVLTSKYKLLASNYIHLQGDPLKKFKVKFIC